MTNKIKCQNCNSENDFFKINCDSCGAVLRNKVANIDLFSMIWMLIEEPTRGVQRLIYAEKKNYLTLILFLLVTKLVLTSFFLQSLFISQVNYEEYLSLNFGIGFGLFLFLFLLYPLLFKTILKSKSVFTRYKDNLTIIAYSHVPLVLSLIFILPVEFALFGKFWLFSNPSPFIINETVAYIFSAMEILTLLWVFILIGISSYVQSNSRVFSISTSAMYALIFLSIFFIIPFYSSC